MNLGYLVYVSKASPTLTQDDIDEILSVCNVKNKAENITGMLLFIEGRFLQVLEGDIEKIELLYEKINEDDRHTDVITITKGLAKVRVFKNWTMRFKRISHSEFRKISGINTFQRLFLSEPKIKDKLIMTFVRKFSDKAFPSKNWWAV